MTDHYSGKLSFIESKRIRLIAATAGLVADDLSGHEALGASLSVQVPENWPPELYDRNAMDFAASQLGDPAERGWSFWYLVDKSSQPEELLGICGFKGRPDGKGSVEIGYSVLSQNGTKGLSKIMKSIVRYTNDPAKCIPPTLTETIREKLFLLGI